MKKYLLELLERFRIGDDQAREEDTINYIESVINFQGAKLWLLIIAIFVASLGLNTNSTAVIIGAMLISPLMGPILGMGLSAGIHDFAMLKKSFKSFIVATLFSVATALVYFLITPFDEAQSELLARTSPTIYDVLIALCGGLAGIIGINSKSQKSGNVIPGVAIATALMPPLCTVGFGIATDNWLYALGALYLYVINAVFISLATFMGVSLIFKFKKKTALDEAQERKFRNILIVIVAFVIIPSFFVTIRMVEQSIFENNARKFCKNVVRLETSHLIGNNIDYKNRKISLIFMGDEVDSLSIRAFENELEAYDLNNTRLEVIQGNSGLSEDDIKQMVNHSQELLMAKDQQKSADDKKIESLEQELAPYRTAENLATEILPEITALFPSITSISLARGKKAEVTDTAGPSATILAVYTTQKKLSQSDQARLSDWLKKRTNCNELILIQN